MDALNQSDHFRYLPEKPMYLRVHESLDKLNFTNSLIVNCTSHTATLRERTPKCGASKPEFCCYKSQAPVPPVNVAQPAPPFNQSLPTSSATFNVKNPLIKIDTQMVQIRRCSRRVSRQEGCTTGSGPSPQTRFDKPRFTTPRLVKRGTYLNSRNGHLPLAPTPSPIFRHASKIHIRCTTLRRRSQMGTNAQIMGKPLVLHARGEGMVSRL